MIGSTEESADGPGCGCSIHSVTQSNDPLDTRLEGRRVHSHHLYQIFSYATNWQARATTSTQTQGWLLYAAVDRDFDYHFKLGGGNRFVFAQ